MPQAFVALVAIAVLIAMSLRANQRFRKEARLPMQWSFTESVNWTAPRSVALAFTPALGFCILLVVVLSTWIAQPRQERRESQPQHQLSPLHPCRQKSR